MGPEPTYCTAFVEDKAWRKSVRVHGQDGFKVYPKTIVDRGVVRLYESARRPQPEPVQPFDADTKERIESLYENVRTQIE